VLIEHAVFAGCATQQRNLLRRQHTLEDDVSILVVLLDLSVGQLGHGLHSGEDFAARKLRAAETKVSISRLIHASEWLLL
jgi:hypothetical protein